ncbi:MAG TPA: hypothetical protein VJS38_07025 [Phenylobacterium sp.]|uniref:hypothetical protein n=1 Tax=Phenylobacterium sp. TaxID=1871053 RepID=UPI002B460CBB|nr:hypothetical protein [Phenylobacterium sp.]HKR87912.1 hypothetical protein [Phenylobacterium sp.]HKT54457.1 hypothetical protein [Caulobacteraceae bacterium]
MRAGYEIIRGSDGRTDVAATLAQTQDYAAAGVTMLRLESRRFCRRLEDFEAFLERAIQAKEAKTA